MFSRTGDRADHVGRLHNQVRGEGAGLEGVGRDDAVDGGQNTARAVLCLRQAKLGVVIVNWLQESGGCAKGGGALSTKWR